MTSSDQRVKIEIPEHYKKVDSSVWNELESYLFTGFLHSNVDIAGHEFVFKTLNHLEIKNTDFHRPLKTSSDEVHTRYKSTIVAYSVFMYDGENILPNRTRHLSRLIKIFSKIDNKTLTEIVKSISLLNKKASRLFPLTEVYVHENNSRFKWLQAKNCGVNSPQFTGVHGTDVIGMNYCQQVWTSLNHILDVREEVERSWNNSKFIGSCMNSKGVRSIEEKDKARQTTEKDELEELKMQVLMSYLNRDEKGEPRAPETQVKLPDGRMAIVDSRSRAESAEELAEQLSQALSGEKDQHDLAVERALKRVEDRNKKIDEEKMNIYRAEFIDDGNVSSIIQGGKLEADARASRIKLLHQQQIETMYRNVNPDLNDESSIDID